MKTHSQRKRKHSSSVLPAPLILPERSVSRSRVLKRLPTADKQNDFLTQIQNGVIRARIVKLPDNPTNELASKLWKNYEHESKKYEFTLGAALDIAISAYCRMLTRDSENNVIRFTQWCIPLFRSVVIDYDGYNELAEFVLECLQETVALARSENRQIRDSFSSSFPSSSRGYSEGYKYDLDTYHKVLLFVKYQIRGGTVKDLLDQNMAHVTRTPAMMNVAAQAKYGLCIVRIEHLTSSPSQSGINSCPINWTFLYDYWDRLGELSSNFRLDDYYLSHRWHAHRQVPLWNERYFDHSTLLDLHRHSNFSLITRVFNACWDRPSVVNYTNLYPNIYDDECPNMKDTLLRFWLLKKAACKEIQDVLLYGDERRYQCYIPRAVIVSWLFAFLCLDSTTVHIRMQPDVVTPVTRLFPELLYL